MEIQKIFSNVEDPEENLYSVLISEEELSLFSEALDNENEKRTSSSLGTAGKLALGGGTAAALAGGIGQNVIADKIATKAAKKYGVEKIGKGLASGFIGVGKRTAKTTADIANRAIKQNKGFKAAKRADLIGTGVALTGAGMLLANKNKNKDNK